MLTPRNPYCHPEPRFLRRRTSDGDRNHLRLQSVRSDTLPDQARRLEDASRAKHAQPGDTIRLLISAFERNGLIASTIR